MARQLRMLSLAITGLVVLAAPAASEPYVQHLANVLAGRYRAKEPAIAPPASLSLSSARLVQEQFLVSLGAELGPVVGYKVGLTNLAAQQRFGVSQPLRGFLLEQMLLPSGTKLAVDFGTRPLMEGDLMVRVKDLSINQAQTDLEMLGGLDAVLPFLELPDLVYQSPQGLNAAALVAVNVGARLGVVGEPIPLEATTDWALRLGRIELQVLDEQGAVVAEGNSAMLLGHPLNVVRWLRDQLKAEGRQLQPGDLLSLGTLTPLQPAKPGEWRARYVGLAEQPVELKVTLGELRAE